MEVQYSFAIYFILLDVYLITYEHFDSQRYPIESINCQTLVSSQ